MKLPKSENALNTDSSKMQGKVHLPKIEVRKARTKIHSIDLYCVDTPTKFEVTKDIFGDYNFGFTYPSQENAAPFTV